MRRQQRRFRIYSEEKIGTAEDGGTLYRYRGCDGSHHAEWYVVDFRKSQRHFYPVVTAICGECNGTCHNDEGLGEFSYSPVPSTFKVVRK